MRILICKNYVKRKKFIKKLEASVPDTDITLKSCIGMCKYCKLQPTAVINGKKIKKKSIKKFLKLLKKK